jgi:hypothetical protein
VWLRRTFTDPVDDTVATIDTKRRRFDGTLARLLVYRDQHCRHPHCDSPIGHLDHITPHRNGGPTTAVNGQGLCEHDNHVKEMPGWTTRHEPTDGDHGGEHRLWITTPTGHTYISSPPPALGPGGNHRQRQHRTARRRLETIMEQGHAARRTRGPTQSRPTIRGPAPP